MIWKVYRDCDSWRLRKVVIELYDSQGDLIDRRRCFAGPLLNRRLLRKARRMTKIMDIFYEFISDRQSAIEVTFT